VRAAQASRTNQALLLAVEGSLRQAQESKAGSMQRGSEGRSSMDRRPASMDRSSMDRLDAGLQRVLLHHRSKEAANIDRRVLNVGALESEQEQETATSAHATLETDAT